MSANPPLAWWVEEVTQAALSVAAGVLSDPTRLAEVLSVVRPAELADATAATILSATEELAAEGVSAEYASVFAHLRTRGRLADLGPHPAAFLADLRDRDPTGAALDHNLARLARASTARALDQTLAEAALDNRSIADPDQVLDRVAARLADLSGGGMGDPPPLPELLDAAADRIDARQTGRALENRVPTGLVGLDELLGRLKPGALYVLAGRPGDGKTALAVTVAMNAAAAGHGAFLSVLEMTADELTDRLLAMQSGVPMQRVTGTGRLTEEEVRRVVEASGHTRRLPIYLDDTPGRTAAQVAAAAARAVRRRKARLVVVDYLGLLRPDDPRAPRYQQVGRDAWQMKLLARQLNVPVLLLCQLNRGIEARADALPRLSDLRDSGEIEQHADAVLALHRDPLTAQQPVQRVDLLVLKHRNGPTGKVLLDYRPASVRFSDFAPNG